MGLITHTHTCMNIFTHRRRHTDAHTHVIVSVEFGSDDYVSVCVFIPELVSIVHWYYSVFVGI